MSINFLSFLFLPGVIIHELAHLLVAAILFVPVGEMEFTPKKSESGLKLGSVEIAKTDPIRRSIIGFAPVFAGFMIIVGIVYFFSSNVIILKGREIYVATGVILAAAYILFAVSNTMFSSARDMEGTAEVLVTLLIVFAAAYALGFRPQLTFIENLFTKELSEVIRKSTIFLSVPIFIDLIILGTINLFHRR